MRDEWLKFIFENAKENSFEIKVNAWGRFFFLRIILILAILIIFYRILHAKKKKSSQIFFLLFVRFLLDAKQESRVQSPSDSLSGYLTKLSIFLSVFFSFSLSLFLSLPFLVLWSTTGLYPDRLNIWTGSTSLMKFPVSPRERELSSRSLERLQS